MTVQIAATDNCGSVTSWINGVTNNETGTADAQIVDATHVLLRATRFGKGSGRVYTITVKAIDPSGNATYGTVQVTVPHDQGH